MSRTDPGINGALMVMHGKTIPEAHALFGSDMPVSGDHLTQWRAFAREEPQIDLWSQLDMTERSC